mgnify:CR=1 FL=1
MNNKRPVVAGLALASLLAVNAVFADEIVVTETLNNDTIQAAKEQRDLAKKANTSAAEKAAQAVLASTKLDLDIRLIGPTSVKIAGER